MATGAAVSLLAATAALVQPRVGRARDLASGPAGCRGLGSCHPPRDTHAYAACTASRSRDGPRRGALSRAAASPCEERLTSCVSPGLAGWIQHQVSPARTRPGAIEPAATLLLNTARLRRGSTS